MVIEDEYIAYGKRLIESIFKNRKVHPLIQRKTKQFSPFKNYTVSLTCHSFKWEEDGSITSTGDDHYPSDYRENFTVTGQAEFKNTDTGLIGLESISISLIASVSYSSDGEILFNVFDNDEDLLEKHNKIVKKQIEKLKLPGFFSDEIMFGNKRLLEKFIDSNRVDKDNMILTNDLNYFYELARILENIKYNIGLCSLHSNYTTEFDKDPMDHNGMTIYRYFPTFHDRIYHSIIDSTYSQYISFWDRVAFWLNHLFPIPEKAKLYFTTVFSQMEKDERVTDSQNFKNLQNFRYGKFKEMNDIRKDVIHNKVTQSLHFESYINSKHNFEEIQELERNRVEMLKELQEFYAISIDAFIVVIELVEEIKGKV